jgi:hypothetical protein
MIRGMDGAVGAEGERKRARGGDSGGGAAKRVAGPRRRSEVRSPAGGTLEAFVAADVRLCLLGREALLDGSGPALAAMHGPFVEHLVNSARQSKVRLPDPRPSFDPTRMGPLARELHAALHNEVTDFLVRVARTLPYGMLVGTESVENFVSGLVTIAPRFSRDASLEAESPGVEAPDAEASLGMDMAFPPVSAFDDAWIDPPGFFQYQGEVDAGLEHPRAMEAVAEAPGDGTVDPRNLCG